MWERGWAGDKDWCSMLWLSRVQERGQWQGRWTRYSCELLRANNRLTLFHLPVVTMLIADTAATVSHHGRTSTRGLVYIVALLCPHMPSYNIFKYSLSKAQHVVKYMVHSCSASSHTHSTTCSHRQTQKTVLTALFTRHFTSQHFTCLHLLLLLPFFLLLLLSR